MTGEAKITKGYNLKAKHVIHTVGPIYSDAPSDPIKLADCYRNSLNLAKEHGLHSIAFPSISTGVYGYPLEEATEVVAYTVTKWLEENQDYDMHIIFVCFGEKAYSVYNNYFN